MIVHGLQKRTLLCLSLSVCLSIYLSVVGCWEIAQVVCRGGFARLAVDFPVLSAPVSLSLISLSLPPSLSDFLLSSNTSRRNTQVARDSICNDGKKKDFFCTVQPCLAGIADDRRQIP